MGFLFNVILRIHTETTLFPRSGCLGDQTTAVVEARLISTALSSVSAIGFKHSSRHGFGTIRVEEFPCAFRAQRLNMLRKTRFV